MLVVISIIALLSVLVIAQLKKFSVSGKDVKRQSDVAIIGQAIASYTAENFNQLPETTCTISGPGADCPAELTDGIKVTLPMIPNDPDSSNIQYTYQYDGTTCSVSARLSDLNTYSYISTTAADAEPPSFVCGTSTVADVDGHTYETILMGTQCWFKSNLMTSKYVDGTAISRGPTGSSWDTNDNGYYAYPPNASNNGEELLANITANKLGYVYQFSATANIHGGLCPAGWHVPTHDQITTMERWINGSTAFPYDTTTIGGLGTDEGSKLSMYTFNGNNSTGFSLVLPGARDVNGSFYGKGTAAYLWSSTRPVWSAWMRYFSNGETQILRDSYDPAFGFSVRCLKN